jgi:hypothetical protein
LFNVPDGLGDFIDRLIFSKYIAIKCFADIPRYYFFIKRPRIFIPDQGMLFGKFIKIFPVYEAFPDGKSLFFTGKQQDANIGGRVFFVFAPVNDLYNPVSDLCALFFIKRE